MHYVSLCDVLDFQQTGHAIPDGTSVVCHFNGPAAPSPAGGFSAQVSRWTTSPTGPIARCAELGGSTHGGWKHGKIWENTHTIPFGYEQFAMA